MQDRWKKGRVHSLAVVGLAKNAGKTTVLNTLASRLEAEGRSVGFLSIGVDGEERDVWTLKKKPPVVLPPGSLAATAASLLDEKGGDWELLETTPLNTPLGPVTLARALRRVRVKLAGVTRKEGVREVLTRFRERGAEQILVDGAYDRKAAASPWITDAAICVAGAAIARSLDGLMEKTEEAVHLLTLPEAKDPLLRSAAEQAVTENRLVGIRKGRVEALPCSSLLLADRVREVLDGGEWRGLALPGSLTDRGLERLRGAGHPVDLVLADPTRAFVSLRSLRRFYREGSTLSCLRVVRLAAVAVNPVSPSGYTFDPGEMKERTARICHPVPVFDAVRDGVDGLEEIKRNISGG
ncbi:hypothetical protein C8P63_10562 [Melghirimyces profundicolus]|uniref:Uncharacterized protein n=1 Tax=Melghirimyces profundicolus TaxID=1242148 RepID=A0A2T6C2K1_9BACL|nr:hypothetical protein [Melghirimyces profundicolus]PTX62467.1 hypothetical protein C8P63_10562 [Melghirimyces profundicolus]